MMHLAVDTPRLGRSLGTYDEQTIVYESRDGHAGLVALVTMADGPFARRPIVLLQHGFSQEADDVPTATARRWADRGFCAVRLGLRGRNDADGDNDACGREILDVIDGLATVRAALGDAVSRTRAGIVGYSGGGAVAVACLAKCPDLLGYYVTHFGITDFGLFPGWWATNAGFQSIIEDAVGDIGVDTPTASPTLYSARRTVEPACRNLVMAPSSVRLEIAHSPDDTTVPPVNSHYLYQRALQLGLSERVSFTLDASILHDYPENSPGVLELEDTYWQRLFNADAWMVPDAGETIVTGFLVTKRFEVYLGASGEANPATVDYHEYRARLVWRGDDFTITPLDGVEISVTVIKGDLSAHDATVSSTQTLTVGPGV